MTSKPLMIAETASGEATGAQAAQGYSKAGWIASAFANEIPSAFPRIGAVLWMNDDLSGSEGCCNWSIESSAAALAAARQNIGDNGDYLGSYSATPVLQAPAEGATGVSLTPTLRWQGSAGSAQYTAYVWDPQAGRMKFQASTAQTSITVPASAGLAGSTFYYWTAQACNGSCGPLARWEGFTTQASATPGTPALLSPVEGAVGVSLTPTIQWSAAGGAGQYTAFVWDPAAGAMAYQATTAGLSLTLPGSAALQPDRFYYYSVQACNAAGCGPIARWEGFTTRAGLGAPGLVVPLEGSTGDGTQPTIRWTATSGATQYTVFVWDPAAVIMMFQQTTTALSAAVPASAGLQPGHFYYYSVQACTGSVCGPLARWEGFTT